MIFHICCTKIKWLAPSVVTGCDVFEIDFIKDFILLFQKTLTLQWDLLLLIIYVNTGIYPARTHLRFSLLFLCENWVFDQRRQNLWVKHFTNFKNGSGAFPWITSNHFLHYVLLNSLVNTKETVTKHRHLHFESNWFFIFMQCFGKVLPK